MRKVFEDKIPLILFINSKLLYNCLVKLRTTPNKHFMINIMSFHQFYEKHKITENM